jgi:hypothetical protein
MKFAWTVVCLLAALPVAGFAAGSQVLRAQVEADHAALLAAERDYELRAERGELGASAAAEYAGYLQRLRERLAADCRVLLQAGNPGSAPVPCRELAAGAVEASITAAPAPPGREERTAILDTELEKGLAEFDELLLREQQRVRAAAPRAPGGGAAGQDAPGDAGSGSAAAATSDAMTGTASGGGAVETDTGQAQGGDAQRPPGAGAGAERAARAGEPAPPDVPGGGDDDVVARQLREAAEQETDPELKEKLWEEYRRYKRGIR